MDVIVERADIGCADRGALRVPVSDLAQRVERGPDEAGVECSGRRRLLGQKLLLERAIFDAQVGLQQIGNGQAGVGRELLRYPLTIGVGKFVALHQRDGVIASRKGFDLGEEALQVGGAIGDAIVIPGGRRIRRQRDDVGQIDAWIQLRVVGDEIPVEDVRQQDQPVEVDVALLQSKR